MSAPLELTRWNAGDAESIPGRCAKENRVRVRVIADDATDLDLIMSISDEDEMSHINCDDESPSKEECM